MPNTKYADAGWCAVVGLFAALQVQAGSTAAPDLLASPNDLFGMTLDPNVPELRDVAAGTRTLAGVAWADHRDHQIRISTEPSRV